MEDQRSNGSGTLCDLYSRNAARCGTWPALTWRDGEGAWHLHTWASYRELVADVAMGLAALGVGRGEGVAIMLGDRHEQLVADGAALHLAATPVPLRPFLGPAEILPLARSCRAKVAILEGPEVLARWDDLRKDLPDLEHVVLVDRPEDHVHLSWVSSWTDVVERGRALRAAHPTAFDARWAQVRPQDVAALLFWPQGGVRPSQGEVRRTLAALQPSLGADAGGRVLCDGPLADVADRVAAHWLVLQTAGCAVFAGATPEAVRASRPQVVLAGEALWAELAAALAAAMPSQGGLRAWAARRGAEVGRAVARRRAAGARVPLGLRWQRGVLDRLALGRVRAAVGLDRCSLALAVPALEARLREQLEAHGLLLREVDGSWAGWTALAGVPPAGIEPARRL